jgi:aminomuconate-semialdehyde/2-hydroxymuconate-6-semialdehyde dehydrogenase
MQHLKNFINGQYLDPVHKNYLDNINPATGTLISKIPASTAEDVELAVSAAQNAFPEWSRSSLESRFSILHKISELIEADIEKLAIAETCDTGKAIRHSQQIDIPRAASNFRFFATAAMQFASESHDMPGQGINYTLRQPIGLTGCISPWNLPLYLFSWKVAPALAMGNCVIAKPSEFSPTTAYLLGEICNQAGLPAGVLNIIQGYGHEAGEAIVSHPDIKAISFTGGTKTGAHIASVAAPKFKKLSLELGGKNPCLVFADCNYEKTVKQVARLAFSNSGQICLCGSRILIEEAVYEAFKVDLVKEVRKFMPSDPLDEQCKMGSLISAQHQQKVLSYIELAKSEGGRLLCGGEAFNPGGACNHGYFVLPTIFEGLASDSRCNMEEIFGPVITLQSFKTEAEAIKLANLSHYGLAATVWTENLSRVQRITNSLQTGIVWVNCWLLRDLRTPFGGMNDSGVGREGGVDALRFFTEPKNVCINFEPI